MCNQHQTTCAKWIGQFEENGCSNPCRRAVSSSIVSCHSGPVSFDHGTCVAESHNWKAPLNQATNDCKRLRVSVLWTPLERSQGLHQTQHIQKNASNVCWSLLLSSYGSLNSKGSCKRTTTQQQCKNSKETNRAPVPAPFDVADQPAEVLGISLVYDTIALFQLQLSLKNHPKTVIVKNIAIVLRSTPCLHHQ